MVDPDLELREGGRTVFCRLPFTGFSSFCDSFLFFVFFSFNKGGKFLKKLWCCVGGRV